MANLPAEVNVKIELEEGDVKLNDRYLVYDAFSISRDDATIQRLVQESLGKLMYTPEDPDITLRIIVKL